MNNLITNNVASTHGGGITIFEQNADYGEAVVQNNVVAFNTVSESDYGGGIAVWQYTAPFVINNVVYRNSPSGMWVNDASYGADVAFNDVYDNGSDYAGDRGSLSGVRGNISTLPGFVGASDDGNVANDGFTLSASSALIDAGDIYVLDVDGSPERHRRLWRVRRLVGGFQGGSRRRTVTS